MLRTMPGAWGGSPTPSPGRWGGGHAIELHARGHLLRGEPLFVGKTEFEFVAIAGNVLAAEYGQHFGQLYLADARKVVPNLLLLETELFLVGQALPFAAATHAEVLAEGLGAEFGVFFYGNGFRLCVTVFLALDLKIHHIARHDVRHEDNEVVHLGNGLALGGDVGDEYVGEYGKGLSLS